MPAASAAPAWKTMAQADAALGPDAVRRRAPAPRCDPRCTRDVTRRSCSGAGGISTTEFHPLVGAAYHRGRIVGGHGAAPAALLRRRGRGVALRPRGSPPAHREPVALTADQGTGAQPRRGA